ncbi:ATP-binding protein [bacterium]|nr:ATP-binding protein [bacterium]
MPDSGIKRDITSSLIPALHIHPIIVITGARRSGKSYLFRQLISHLVENDIPPVNILFINFEDPYFTLHRNSVDLLDKIMHEYKIQKNPMGKIYCFFDEIQNIPNWNLWVREVYDRDDTVKFLLTGSNSEMLSIDLATHLTGRIIAFENFPFSFQEYVLSLPNLPLPHPITYENAFPYQETIIHLLEERMQKGLFPELIKMENFELEKEMLNQYFQNVLFKDIIPRFSIRNSKTIEQLAYYCSNTFATRYSFRNLAKAVSSNENTVKEYLSYLERAYLFFSVEPFEYSFKRQIRYDKKLYIADNGLRNATSSSFSPDYGRAAENMVFTHLRRESKTIYFWQDPKTGKEIDFIVKKKTGYHLLNISYTDNLHEREWDTFSIFLNNSNLQETQFTVISRNRYETIIHDGIQIQIVPLWLWLLTQ